MVVPRWYSRPLEVLRLIGLRPGCDGAVDMGREGLAVGDAGYAGLGFGGSGRPGLERTF